MDTPLQGRKWQLTFNNPKEHGFTHETIREIMSQFSGLLYWCMADEVGHEGTYHTHLYFVLKSATYATVIANRFPGAHRERTKGTSQQNRDYISKSAEQYNKDADGHYEYEDKEGKKHSGTNYADTFEEYGEMPNETQGKSKDVDRIYALIKDGASNTEIVDTVPSGMLQIDKIERTRSMLRDAQFAENWRDLEVTYIFGITGTGKTRGVMDKYGYKHCYRVTDYKHPFDTYDGQDVLILEEYRSQFKIADILNYLDGYPLLLPCRYFNRQACYTKVFLISNIPLENQYSTTFPESRAAFFRRITSVVEYKQDGQRIEYPSMKHYKYRNETMPIVDLYEQQNIEAVFPV